MDTRHTHNTYVRRTNQQTTTKLSSKQSIEESLLFRVKGTTTTLLGLTRVRFESGEVSLKTLGTRAALCTRALPGESFNTRLRSANLRQRSVIYSVLCSLLIAANTARAIRSTEPNDDELTSFASRTVMAHMHSCVYSHDSDCTEILTSLLCANQGTKLKTH